MKTQIGRTVVIALTLSACLYSHAQIIFSEVFQGPYIDHANGVAPTTDNGNVVCGNTFDAISQWDAVMIKLDASGVEEWNMTIGIGGNSEELQDVIQSQSGDFVAIGSTTSFSAFATRETWIVRVSPIGTLLWSLRYPNGAGADEDGWRIVELPTGELIAMSAYVNHGRLTKLTASGTVVWSKSYGTTPLAYMGFTDLTATTTGNVVLSGIGTGTGLWWGVNRGILAEVDTSGAVQWWKEYGDMDFTQFMAVRQQTAGEGSEHPDLVVTGIRMPSGVNGDDSLLVARTTSTGDLLWAKVVPYARGLELEIGNGTDDMLVTGGNYDVLDTSVLVLSVDGSGTVQWGRSVSIPGLINWEIARAIRKNVDGTYTMAGSALHPPFGGGWGYHGAYLVRFDDPMAASACWQPTSHALVPIPMPVNVPSYTVTNVAVTGIAAPMTTGMTLPLTDMYCSTVGVEELNAATGVFAKPTAVSDLLYISHDGHGRPMNAEVFDAGGRLVRPPIEVGSTETTVDVHGMASGAYIIMMGWKDVVHPVRFVVVH